MKESVSSPKSYTLVAPSRELPDLITACPRCGGEIELWSEDDETRCVFCGHKLFERETTTH